MLTLYLLRHAKASWGDATQPDLERTLTNQGRETCATIAEFIREKDIDFAHILVSTAVRTRETIELINDKAKLHCEVHYDERIYEASVSQLLEIISEVDNDRESVLLVGHNPGIEGLISLLTREQHHVPTATFAKIKLETTKWSELLTSKGTLDWIVRPREI